MFFAFNFLLISLGASVFAAEKRTDGPPGSEFGDFSRWDGRFSMGALFGAITHSDGDESSFTLGVDADYRPTDVFGFRLGLEHAVEKPRTTLINFMPLIHSDFSNFKPYLSFGPGVGIISAAGKTNTKFNLAAAAGGDFMMTDFLGFGMRYTYNFVFDFDNIHSFVARFSYHF